MNIENISSTVTTDAIASNLSGHIAAIVAHGVMSPLVGLADSQTLANKTLIAPTIINPTNNTFTPATLLVRDDGAGVQSISRVDGIASTMLSDSNNLVCSLTSPTFANVTANDITSATGYLVLDSPHLETPQRSVCRQAE